MFQLDNEPGLWSATHRDVHPNALTYDELWNFTVAYASAVKSQYPNVKIFGPIFWGYCSYMFSPADGCADGPDRKAHGDLPLLQWYISQIAAYKQAHGVQLIDYIDVHFYPQEDNVAFSADETPATAQLRLSSTRGLWDPTYVDESWISEPIFIIPRIQSWASMYNLNVGIAISEYNFGADNIITGALAQAEVLGIFAAYNVSVGARWVVPELGSITEEAYKLYLNYDGKGSSVKGNNVYAASNNIEEVGSYAFYDGNVLYLVMICKQPVWSVPATVDVSGITLEGTATLYTFAENIPLQPAGTVSIDNGAFFINLLPWSATIAVINK